MTLEKKTAVLQEEIHFSSDSLLKELSVDHGIDTLDHWRLIMPNSFIISFVREDRIAWALVDKPNPYHLVRPDIDIV